MRLQYSKIPREEYRATYHKLHVALWEQLISRTKKVESAIYCFDSDFLITTNINDARWLFMPNVTIAKIGNDGSVIHLVPEH